nr:PREDICTED: TNF receptor-associated factor 6 [Bemisia tabaci]
MDLRHMKEDDSLPQDDLKSSKVQLFDQRYECPVCLSCLKDPVLTKCGHRFCESCIHMWLEKRSKSCPIDGAALEDSDLFPDLYTKREILEQRILCPFEGCGISLPLMELDGHMTECSFKENVEPEKEKECSFKAFGCLAVLTNSEDLSKHLQSELHNHMELLVKTCSRLTQPSLAHKAQESEHFWSPSKADEESPAILPQKELIRALYERIVLLEQSNREQEAELRKSQQQVSSLSAELSVCKEHLSRIMHSGEYVWKINKFKLTLNRMLINPTYMYYSPYIYTSAYGYRFRARLNISLQNKNYLALNIHLVSGDHDATLDWPFSGQIMLAVAHPDDSLLTVKETVMSEPDLEAFKRPIKDMMNARAFGFNEFISISQVLENGYLDDDTLIIRIQVKII